MSGGWGEGRADCAQANSFRLKLLRHVTTRYETLRLWVWTFQPKVSVVPVSTRCQSPLNGELCAESDEAQATACRGWKWHARGRCVLVLEISGFPKCQKLLEIGLQIGVNDLQWKKCWTSTLHVRTYGLDPWLCLLRVRLSWMNDSDGTDFEALCLQSFMESGLVRSESHWTSKFRWILQKKSPIPRGPCLALLVSALAQGSDRPAEMMRSLGSMVFLSLSRLNMFKQFWSYHDHTDHSSKMLQVQDAPSTVKMKCASHLSASCFGWA